MYISVDLKCPKCGHTARDVFIDKRAVDNVSCRRCRIPMVKKPSAPATTFRFADEKLKR